MVFDGVDVLMLFGEILVGKYFFVVVWIMLCIICVVEENFMVVLLLIYIFWIKCGVILYVVCDIGE